MAGFTCKSLTRKDPQAAKLRRLLRQHAPQQSIDTGVPYLKCTETECTPGIRKRTKGNGKFEAGEVYQATIALLEREEDAFAASGGNATRPFTDLVAQKTPLRIPWLFNDFDATTTDDDERLLAIAWKIGDVKTSLRKEGF